MSAAVLDPVLFVDVAASVHIQQCTQLITAAKATASAGNTDGAMHQVPRALGLSLIHI